MVFKSGHGANLPDGIGVGRRWGVAPSDRARRGHPVPGPASWHDPLAGTVIRVNPSQMSYKWELIVLLTEQLICLSMTA